MKFFKEEKDPTQQLHGAIKAQNSVGVKAAVQNGANLRKPPKDIVDKDLLDTLRREYHAAANDPRKQQNLKSIYEAIRTVRAEGSKLAVHPRPRSAKLGG